MLLSNKGPWGFVRWGLICNNDFVGMALFEKGLFEEWRLIKIVSSLREKNFPIYNFQVFEAEPKC